MKAGRRRHAVQLREPRDVIFRGHARQLLVQRLQHSAIEQCFGGEHRRGLRGERRGGGEEGDDRANDAADAAVSCCLTRYSVRHPRSLAAHGVRLQPDSFAAGILTDGADPTSTVRLKPDTTCAPDTTWSG